MYLTIYAILVALGSTLQQRREEGAAVALTMLFLLVFMGTRHEVGCDYYGYFSRFQNVSVNASLWDAFSKPEIGFELLTIAVVTSGLDYVWLNVISSAIILGCFWYFLRHQQNAMLILAIFFPVVILQLGMSGLRQAIAVGIVLVATVQFMKGRKIATALIILLAGQFHTSAYLFLPLAAIAGNKVTFGRLTWAALALFPAAIFLLWDRLDVYQDRYVAELYGDQDAGGAIFRYVLVFIPSALFFFNLEKMERAFPKQFELLKVTSLAALALLPLTVLSSFMLHRLNYYLMPTSIVTFVYLMTVMFKERELKIAMLLPAIVYGVYTLGWQSLSGHFDICYVPYQSVLL